MHVVPGEKIWSEVVQTSAAAGEEDDEEEDVVMHCGAARDVEPLGEQIESRKAVVPLVSSFSSSQLFFFFFVVFWDMLFDKEFPLFCLYSVKE
ncbi:unnamed protein product [Caenorhabditis auriculariae]|uniref:Uncharacterized protein n=1 Tax=Caenorhabditis auriculariae TaxID=2777116 RepID=A0A8S1HTV4_9PELO|nr:unnamed protein product [Caenorhabditis auriculariae]